VIPQTNTLINEKTVVIEFAATGLAELAVLRRYRLYDHTMITEIWLYDWNRFADGWFRKPIN